MSKREPTVTIEPFDYAPDDPLAAEHAQLLALVAEATTGSGWQFVNLSKVATYGAISGADRNQSLRYVRAAVAQLRHNRQQAERVLTQAVNEIQAMNSHLLPGGMEVVRGRRALRQVVDAMLRRKLPVVPADLSMIADWMNASQRLSGHAYPFKPFARLLAGQPADVLADDSVRGPLTMLAAKLRDSAHDRELAKIADDIESLLRSSANDAVLADDAAPVAVEPIDTALFEPAEAGDPRVLVALKRECGLAAAIPDAPTTALAPDGFPLRIDAPLSLEHARLTTAFTLVAADEHGRFDQIEALSKKHGQAIAATAHADGGRMAVAACERADAAFRAGFNYEDRPTYRARSVATTLWSKLLPRNGEPFDRAMLFDALLYATSRVDLRHRRPDAQAFIAPLAALDFASLTAGERYAIHRLRCLSIAKPPMGDLTDVPRRLGAMLGEGAVGIYLVPGEHWADAVNADIARLRSAAKRDAWISLLRHAATANGSRPSPKWLATAGALLKKIGGRAAIANTFGGWLRAVVRERSIRLADASQYGGADANGLIDDGNADVLRGLLWCVPLIGEPATLSRAVATCTLSAYKKIRGLGPRATKVGNACVYALSAMGDEHAVGQLALLKVKVKFGSAQKEIEKAFAAAAAKLGLPRDEVEELGVPSYGLEAVGVRRETFGDGDVAVTATLAVDGRTASLAFARADGRPLKSVPALVKANHKDALKELQAAAKDVAAMLTAQSERIDGLFLAQKSWPLDQWRARYLDHPLVGTIARRLIWLSNGRAFAYRDGGLVDAQDAPLALADDATVALWHPIGHAVADVLAWRAWLDRHRVRQPFKQAHREVYVLTDAERRTETYSNRFAAHVLRQHQFNALCAARGWRNKLRLMVDDEYPPATRDLPHWGLRAEYWIEGIGDAYGTDTAESGAFLRVATDQVRFYRSAAAPSTAHASGGGYTARAAGAGDGNVNEPLSLEQVPPLVLSEVLRDVDLFVSVASVGNDPAWQDGGPGGRYRTYWQQYSFGDLSETAKTRRAVLETLLPRLTKLTGKWSLIEKFLVVRGSLRTYKIHLGSGNILMEPDDQYLCIVPGGSRDRADASVFLPFEGDGTLSIILSKAFLLADDAAIRDPTITRQIKPA